MKTVAVLGGGPGGAFAAGRLARDGFDVVLADEKLAWEKPCGGGLTAKAYRRYPFLMNHPGPKKVIRRVAFTTPDAGRVELRLDEPILIYSRTDLNGLLLHRAQEAGARLVKTRVLGIERAGRQWRIRTRTGLLASDFCVVATGARNSLRGMGTVFDAGDVMRTVGYYIPGDSDRVELEFLPPAAGYIWVFPRCGHLSVGICGKGVPAAALRRHLEDYMRRHRLGFENAPLFSHLLPSLSVQSWEKARFAGEGWLAVGDAAGLADPITGEGLYYALRSAELAAEAVRSAGGDEAGIAATYQRAVTTDFGADLAYAARLFPRFYSGRLLGRPVTLRMVQFLRRSPTFARIVQDLFSGTQPYRRLELRVSANLMRTLLETAASFLPGWRDRTGVSGAAVNRAERAG